MEPWKLNLCDHTIEQNYMNQIYVTMWSELIKGRIALADTGSTHTFLDKQFAMEHNINMTSAPVRTVTVAGGGELLSNAIAYSHTFWIQGKPYVADFRILELNGSDAILGVNWFKYHNPVTFDFVGRTLTIGPVGQSHTIPDHFVSTEELFVSAMECTKLLKEEEATGYMLYNIEEVRTALTELEQTTSPAEFQDILHAFADVFAEPKGLRPAFYQ